MSIRSFYFQSLLLAVLLLLAQSQASAQCSTSAGTLQQGPDYWCPSEYGYTAPYFNLPQPDADDISVAVMHDGTATTLGNIVAITNTGFFGQSTLPASGTYQLALIAGNDADGNGLPDPSDPCYSFAGGATITFAQAPVLTANPAISQLGCTNPSVQINTTVTPAGSYTYDWYAWNAPTPVGPNPVISAAGDYFLIVYDNVTGCSDSTIVVVNGSASYWASVVPTPQDCDAGGDVMLRCTTGLTGNLTYLWSNGATTQDIVVNSATTASYCVTVTNDAGCSASTCHEVTPNQPMNVEVVYYAFGCPDSLNSVYAQVTPQSGQLTYEWNNGVIWSGIWGIEEPGLYSVTVTNGNGCTAVGSYFIEELNACGVANGHVWGDLDNNCLNSTGDVGLAGILVQLTNNATGAQYLTITSQGGAWGHNLESGTYTVQVFEPNNVWLACQNTFTLVVPNGGIGTQDFYLQPVADCPRLTVDIGTSLMRRCFQSFYWVTYNNTGTTAAENAYVDVTLDPFLTYAYSEIPGTDLGNNTWRFQVGDVPLGGSDYFLLTVNVSCDATLGQTHCTEATIYPHEPCGEDLSNWSGASLTITGECDPDSVRFTVKNVGTAASSLLNYVVIEDAVMFLSAPPPTVVLIPNETYNLAVPANGATWRMDVEQEPGHPGLSMPSVTVEGCGTPGSQGFVNQFPVDDADYWKDIDCTENVGSYDPNDKQGFPIGYGAQHYIERGTDIEYLIRFQNTGTAPAFTVVIRDTLSAFLDPATLRPGASSHPYELEFFGEGPNLKFSFNNINLPDSSTNFAASQGFVSFRISQKANVPLESDILNTAAIYFDFNEPIFTNTTQHRLGEGFLAVSAWEPVQPQLQLSIVPNPMNNVATLSVKGLDNGAESRVELLDALGRTVSSGQTTGNTWQIQRGSLPSGYYTVRVVSLDNGLVGVGKIVVK